MFIKDNAEKEITINIKDFYAEANSYQGTVTVSESVYEFLCEDKRRLESRARKDRRYMAGFAFEEVEAGERDGIFSSSTEEQLEDIDECELLHKAIQGLSEYDKKILTIYYFERKKLMVIEAELGIPKSTLSRHLIKARKNLKTIYIELMQK